VVAAVAVRNHLRDTLFIVEHLSSRQDPLSECAAPGRPSRACPR